LKLALQDFGFMVALVVTECVLQYSLALSNLLQRPSIDLVVAASETETVISSLRKIRQDDNVRSPANGIKTRSSLSGVREASFERMRY
jgi:hypothetical protein